MRKVLPFLFLLLLLAAGGSGGWYWWSELRFLEETDDAYVQADISVIAPRIRGYVRQVAVEDNQQVEAGDLLVVIESYDLEARVEELQAGVEAMRAALAGNEREQASQLLRIERALAAVTAAEAALRLARQEFVRTRDLRKTQVASQARYDDALASLRQAEAGVAEGEAAAEAERSQIVVLEAAKREIAARLAQAEAALRAAKIDYAAREIRAPIAGVVGNRAVQVGQWVAPGSQLLSLVPLSSVYVVANFKETQIGRMKLGQPVTLEVDAFPDQPIAGRIESFAPASGAVFSLLPPQNATGNFTKIVQRVPVRIALAPDSPLLGHLRPGLSVVATVDTRAPGGPQVAER